jgi:hypothetical protein
VKPSLAETDGATARASVAAANGDTAIEAPRTHVSSTTNNPPKDLKFPANRVLDAFFEPLFVVPRMQAMSVLSGPCLST